MDDRDQSYWSAVQGLLSQLNSETDPVALGRQIVQERARGGGTKRLLIDQYPTRYLPNVGRQVMADGGAPQDMMPPAPEAAAQAEKLPVLYRSWADVPTINPQDLVGKKVFPIFADLTKAGSAFRGIDASKLDQPEQLYGGPGYPLLPESQEHGLGWAVEGKGRGTSKLLKDADYVAVSAMEPYSHQSNASFSNALMKNMAAYVRDQRLTPEGLAEINKMITAPSAQKDLKGLESFPGFEHPDAEKFLRDMTFEQRKRVSQVLASRAAQDLGAPNIDKITRATLDPEFSGVPSRHAMFLLKIPRSKTGAIDEAEMNKLLVHLKDAGLPEHPSYQYGLRGAIVGKFHAPVAPEILFKDWFDEARENAAKKEESGQSTNVRRAFDLAMPVATISQEVADMLPRHPRDIQSGRAAQLALNAFNDMWDSTDTPVNKGGLGPAALSQALKNSDASSTLSQYSPKEIKDMSKDGKFTGFKLKGGEVYFGLKRGTNYADEYGFEHPELTPNETALVSVVNNEPGAKGIGGAPVVLKAIQHGATALDCYAVPSNRHPNGFLPEFYANFGFQELGRVPFDPKYVSPQQFEDMKHEWTKAGWNESMGLPALSIMKWKGDENDRTDAVRRYLAQSSAGDRPGSNSADVGSAAGIAEQGSQPTFGAAQGERGLGDEGRDRGAVRNDRAPRPADRLARTLAEIKQLSPAELAHYGLRPEDVESARARGLASGGKVDETGDRYERTQEGPFYRLARKDFAGDRRVSEGLRPEAREASAADPRGAGEAGRGDPALSAPGSAPGVESVPHRIARDYVRNVHGRELVAPKLESSLTKQSAIGRSFAEAVKGSPEYKAAIFDAYARMMPEVVEQSGATNYDQLLERAYRQMAAETSQQFETLPFRMSFHRAGEGDYPTSKHMLDDLHNNNHLYVFQGGEPHEFLHNVDPETGLNENEKFRAVHDVFGHGIYGNPFGAKGEENAWAVHSQMYSPLARLAMTAETRGQNSFVNYTPVNALLKEKIAEVEEKIADARRNRNEYSLESALKKKNALYKEFQFAPQKSVLLPPEFLSPDYQGGMPEYMRQVIKPEPGTGFSSALTHYSTVPDMERTDPSRYGTGIPGDEASRLRSRPGGVKERSYFYLGEPEAVTPEEGLGSYRYRAEASDLYDITKDPLNLKPLARESNRMPWSSNFNPGTVEPGQFANDLERLVKEYGYKGFANPNAAFPMAVTFDPTQVERRATGGEVGDDAPYHQTPEFQNWFGDSVAHMDGVPVTYYHGTSKDKDFPSFNVGRHGVWLTSDPEEASQYAEQNDSQNYTYEGGKYVKTNTASRVIPVHLKAENPYLGDKPEEMLQQQNYKKAQSDWFDGLRAQGYDSWIPASQNGALAVILKEPTQIKSIYNRKFDPKNKRMDKASGGHITTLRRMSDPAVNEAIRVINRSGSSPRDAVTLSKRLLGRQ